jgi:hypothetical protein|tara:strand:- start:6 stop:212 length:207 start_codon:yes stop_codon:yes gene_type:complete
MTELTEAHFELHSKNKAKLLEEKKKKETIQSFHDWLDKCPVVYKPVNFVDGYTKIQYIFHTNEKERRE